MQQKKGMLEALTYLPTTFPALWVEVREAAELFIYGFLLRFVRTSLLADGHEPKVCKYSFSCWWLAAVTTTTDEQDA